MGEQPTIPEEEEWGIDLVRRWAARENIPFEDVMATVRKAGYIAAQTCGGVIDLSGPWELPNSVDFKRGLAETGLDAKGFMHASPLVHSIWREANTHIIYIQGE